MTAVRWLVKSFARWQARIDSIKGQIQAVSLLVTAFSTFSIVLQGFGLGKFVPFVGVAVAIATPVYAFLFFEGGVWNQVSRDRVDMSTNYAGPTMRMDDELLARGIIAGQLGRPLNEGERAAIQEELDDGWKGFRDGLPEEYFSDA